MRTETVICNTRDFGIGRRVNGQNGMPSGQLAKQPTSVSATLKRPTHNPPDVVTFNQVTRPSDVDGLHAPGLRFGDPRVMAVMSAIVGFPHLIAGFNNRQLTDLVATLLDTPYTNRQATYDLRRLKRKDLIERRPHSNRYQLTPLGRRVAVLFTKAHGRVLTPGLVALDPRLPEHIAQRSPLARAWRQLDHALDDYIANQLVAA
ncbi:MAG: hypothetical protein ACRDZ3_15010 [Acidimicrobiia bacterium]